MKNIFRVLFLALLGFGLTSVSIAQEQTERDIAYEKFKACYKERADKNKITACQTVGNNLVAKYGKDEDFQEIISWVKGQIAKFAPAIDAINEQERYDNFDNALKAKKTADIFSTGKTILSFEPNNLDVMIILATVGFNSASVDKVDTFNAETFNYSKTIIEKVEKGEKPASGDNWGPGTGDYKYGSKDNLLAWMNYFIGSIMNTRQQKIDESLAYLYKASQFKTSEIAKEYSEPFFWIGKSYLDKYNLKADIAIKLNEEIKAAVKLPVTPENTELIKRKNEEVAKISGEMKAIAERGADAYARAYNVALANPKKYTKANADSLKTFVTNFYKVRFGEKMATPAAVNTFISGTSGRMFVDPTSPIVPVIEAVPTVPVVTTTPPANTKPMTTATPTNAKPATTTPTTTAKPATATPTATKPAAKPAAKPAPKKKGTR